METPNIAGIEIRWIQPPGEEMRAQDDFNVTYELHLTDTFYDWAYTEGYFSHLTSVT